ncbi:MAG: hypothetical protein MRK01_15685 [Candidatus Scalindua sp.]|nr:hypothetical protein [Candidatus Scalindua sp.]
MTSPTKGSQITTSTSTFEWSADSGVSQYWLSIGTSIAALDNTPYGDVYSRNQGISTSATVPTIPLNGNTLYVRLWYKDGDKWEHVDYTYQTEGCTDPYEPNETSTQAYGFLTSGNKYNARICNSIDIDWFKIEVGSAGTITLNMKPPQTSCLNYNLELYDANGVKLDSSTLDGCQTETITYDATASGTYLIKTFGVNGVHDTTDTYELSGTWPEVVLNPPVIMNPAPDLTLTTGTVTFEWDPGTNVTQYWLAVGTSFESLDRTPYGDVYSQNQYLNTSATVSGIPLNGKNLYVRLWFKSGTWKYVDYTYQTQ